MQRRTDTTEVAGPSGKPSFAKVVALIGGASFVFFGLWAFFAPQSFFDTLATFEPYNEHFIHDIGSFQIGLGAVLILGVYLRDPLRVALDGAAIGATIHLISHIIDSDIGGKPSTDIPFFAVTAVLLIAAAITRAREGGTAETEPRG